MDSTSEAAAPNSIKLRTQSGCLELGYGDQRYQLSYEFLRVHSPSAEVRGHGKAVLQTGKKQIKVRQIEPVGNYAIKLVFDDGHDSGLYSWAYLAHLCQHQDQLWQQYLQQLEAAGASRAPTLIGRWQPE